jgi:hypothetical protein
VFLFEDSEGTVHRVVVERGVDMLEDIPERDTLFNAAIGFVETTYSMFS